MNRKVNFMGITVEWQDEAHGIVLVTYTEPWTWDAYFAASKQANALIVESDIPHGYIIADLSDGYVPVGNQVTHGLKVMQGMPDEIRFLVIIIDNTPMRMGFGVLRRLSRQWRDRAHAVATPDDALKLIHADLDKLRSQTSPGSTF